MPPQPSTTMTRSQRRSTQGLLWSLCCSAVALWFLLVATTTTTTVTAVATTQDSHLHLRNRRLHNMGRQATQVASKVPPTNPYALYSLPPFTITFTSAYSAKGLPSDLQERGKLLASTLHAPLQLITAEFLMESFRIEIAQHHRSSGSSSTNSATTSTVSNNNNETTLTFSSSQQDDDEEESVWLQAMLNSFMTLDLQVAVRSLDATGQRQRRMVLEGEPRADATTTTTSSSSTLTKQADVLTFQADFFTTAAFLDPNTHARANNADDDEYNNNNQNTIQLGGTTTTSSNGNNNNGNPSPSNDEVATLMGAWIENAFVKDYEYYTEALVNSEEAVLQNLQSIDIETNSDAVFDPYATGTLSSAATNTHTTSTSTTTNNNNNNNNNGAAAASPNDGGAWSPSEKTFFTVLVMVSVLSIAGLLLAIKRYSVRGRKLRRMLSLEGSGGDFGPGGIDEFSDHVLHNRNFHNNNNNTVLGGRHADEVMDILNASDRYLATHRPDLLEAMQKSQQLQEQRQLHQLQQQHGGGIIPVANNHDDHNNGRPVERRYVTVTNPFSYLYGASYFHSEKQAVEEDRRRARREEEDPMAGVELQPESVPDDEDLDLILADNRHTTDTSVSGFLQTWFQQLVGARTFAAAAASAGPARDDDDDNDNDSGGLIDDVMDDLVIEECLDHAQHGGTTASTILACDEDPSQYKFAYKDFPRQDGTPCLIYEETLDEEEEEQYLRNSKRDSLHSTTTYGIHDPLTDDEFQRALSQHSLMDFQQRSLSFEQQENSSSSSIVQTDDGEFEGDDYDADQSNATNNDDSGAETDPAQFTDKLEKLVAMRHRHYEKQKIVDKHREQRRQERARQRAEQKQKEQEEMKERDRRLRRHSLELDIQELEAAVGSGAGTSVQGPPSTSSKAIVTPTDHPGGHQQQGSWNQQQARANLRQVQKPSLHRRTSSEADKRVSPSAASAGVVGIQTNRSMDLDEHRVLNNQGLMMEASNAASIRSLPMPNNSRLVQSARKDRIALNDIFRPVNHVSPRLISVATESATGSTPNSMPPKFMQKIEIVPVVSPASSMTDTGSTTAPSSGGDRSPSSSRATPPLMMGSGSIRDGSSARKKKRETLSASAALANGFNVRRSMSFGAMEEKKMDDEVMNNSYVDGGSDNSGKQPLPPQRRRSNSVNRHRRSNSNSPADVMVHGIYAQFV